MPTTAKTRRMNGGHAVVDCLRNEGVRHVFNVPGESFTSILDGMRDAQQIQLITNRHEGGACLMAEAYAKATRTPGVCVVTRGPGATHASIGIHCARHDSTPLDVHFVNTLLEYPAPPPNPGRQGWIDEYRKVQQAWATPAERPTSQVSMEKVMMDMKTTLPKDSIHTVDAGNFALWVHKYQEFSVPDTFFGPTVGCMGYGVPSAIGAKLAHPNRVAIAHCGDGGFLMTGQEMATAAQFGINIITVVYNNSALATIRMHQEAQYPNRPSGTDFINPDFAALGTAYRALGIQVTRDNDFLPALQEALKANRPALIEVMTELEYISPTATLSQVTAGQPGR